MVIPLRRKTEAEPKIIDLIDIPEEELNWSTVSLSEIIQRKGRLEASVYDIEGKHAREVLKNCRWKIVNLWSNDGFVETAVYPTRFKRIYVDRRYGIPFFLPSPIIKHKIHEFIMDSFSLRDESNSLIDEAEGLLISELKLPPIDEIKSKHFNGKAAFKNFPVKLSKIDNRIDASYHVPIVNAIMSHLDKYAEEVTTLDDSRISKEITLPGRFKRVYVEEGQGVVFFGGKQLFELDPSNKKYLALIHHTKRIKEELTLKENMIMITCSGTIGKVTIVPRHWENWTANQHILRVVPTDDSIAGYIYAWLSTDYGYELIKRFTYGSVVDEINDNHASRIQIPLLKSKKVQDQINNLILEANKKRYDAYLLEKKAIKIVNDQVISSMKKEKSLSDLPMAAEELAQYGDSSD